MQRTDQRFLCLPVALFAREQLYLPFMPYYTATYSSQHDLGCIHRCRFEVAIVTPTSVSLLDRLKVAACDGSDWKQFEGLYLPLIRRWVSRVPGMGSDVDDVSQDVLVILVREIPRFERQREGSFRAWLRQVTVNRIRVYRRQKFRQPAAAADQTEGFLDQVADSNTLLAQQFDDEHDKHLCDALLATVRPDFSEATWAAFQQFALKGRPAIDVARELKMTVNAVIKAKARVLSRLRQESRGLLD
jgi:RNA polymerase sigma-70 factor (ECF subfamily)